ncbi:MAG TPA: hypothetical protein VIJ55_08500 [Acetobacteraceae bacterium]
MRLPILLLAALAMGVTAPAIGAKRPASRPRQAAPAAGPSELGKFGDWTAARYLHEGKTICYAFTRAKSVHPPEAGATPLLTVTERANSRDEVAISAHDPYPQGTTVTVQVGQTGLDFYTSGSDAFAREGAAAVAALRPGSQAIARAPGPHSTSTVDTFSLAGFTAAYEAIVKACPAK